MTAQSFSKLSSHDRRVVIPPPLWASLVYYAKDEQGRIESEDVRGLITPESLAIEILTNHLTKMKHYPPKDAPVKKPIADITVGS